MKSSAPYGSFNGPAELRMVRTLPGPIERIWDYLVDPEKRARWFAGGPLEQKVGGKVTLKFRHRDLAPTETPPDEYKSVHETGMTMEGKVTRCEPPHVLAFTFGSDGESEVTFELKSEGEKVLLVLTHRATGGDIPYMHEFGGGWYTHVGVLVSLLEGKPAGPFWPTLLKAKADYAELQRSASATA